MAGLSSALFGGGMPAQGTVNPGKLQTYFNNPYMAQIASNLASAIYGDPRDALVQQQMADMQHTRERQDRMDATASEDKAHQQQLEEELAANVALIDLEKDPEKKAVLRSNAISAHVRNHGKLADALTLLQFSDPRFQQNLYMQGDRERATDERQQNQFGQERTMEGVRFGHAMDQAGYNWYERGQAREDTQEHDYGVLGVKFDQRKQIEDIVNNNAYGQKEYAATLDMFKQDDQQESTAREKALDRNAAMERVLRRWGAGGSTGSGAGTGGKPTKITGSDAAAIRDIAGAFLREGVEKNDLDPNKFIDWSGAEIEDLVAREAQRTGNPQAAARAVLAGINTGAITRESDTWSPAAELPGPVTAQPGGGGYPSLSATLFPALGPSGPVPPAPGRSGPVPAPPQRAPVAGDIVDGYRFRGGDPADQKNWIQVR